MSTIVFYDSITEPKVTHLAEMTSADDWYTLFYESDERELKDGRCWSPGWCVDRRSDANCREVCALVLDLDQGDWRATLAKVAGYQHVLHSTHSHAPPDQVKLRVVLPLVTPVPAARWRAFRAAALAYLKIPDTDADPKCKDPSRAYYLPSRRPGVAPVLDGVDGPRFDPASVVAAVPEGAPDLISFVQSIAPPRPVLDPSGPVDLDLVRRDLREAVARKAGQKSPRQQELYVLLCRVRDGAPLAPQGERDDVVNRVASCLANVLHGPPPWEAVQELLRPSLGRMEMPEGLDHWFEVARKKYARAVERREQRAAANREMIARFAQMSAANPGHAGTPPPPDPTASPDPADGEDPDDPPPEGAAPAPWTERLIRCGDDGDRVDPCGPNVALILENQWGRDAFWWDAVRKRVMITAGPAAGLDVESASVEISNWLYATPARIKFQPDPTKKQLVRAARRNERDPLRDYLRSVKWDGTPRVGGWLLRYAGAAVPDVHATTGPCAEYLEEVSRRWMVAAVARGLQPGCKMDNVLVLEGTYGLAKSQAFGVLGGEWFNDTAIVIGDKDSRMLAGVCWISEMPELAAARRGDNESLKGFLSQSTDNFRPPYGAALEQSPRRAVFVGTVNPDEVPQYLTGDVWRRRYWIVPCDRDADLDALRADRDQLFAEAVALYDAAVACPDCSLPGRCAAHRWWFDRHEWAKWISIGEARQFDPGADWGELVKSWWESFPVDKRPERVLQSRIVSEALHPLVKELSTSVSMRLGKVMKDVGFARRKSGGNAWWYPSAELLKTPHVPKFGVLVGGKK